MKVIESPMEAYAHVDHWRRNQQTIGLVPTMGALHEGHLSLVGQSKQNCDISVVSIFVNPTQFGPHEDFAKYPRTMESDLEKLASQGVDLVFTPQPDAIYPDGFSTNVQPPAVASRFEGEKRPDHFQGVATIVLKLFNMLPAHVAFFGQKDYQQLAVIRAMVNDLNVPIRVEGCATVREPDGLAMSSRNRYLSAAERESALSLWKTLQLAAQLYQDPKQSLGSIDEAMAQSLYAHGADHVDYATVAHAETLAVLESRDVPAVALIAAMVGKTRLIDNLLLPAPT